MVLGLIWYKGRGCVRADHSKERRGRVASEGKCVQGWVGRKITYAYGLQGVRERRRGSFCL